MTKINSRYSFIALVFVVMAFLPITKAHAITLSPIRFELSGNPGASVSGEMFLTNDEDSVQTYYSSFANFEAQGETGTPVFVESTGGLSSWITTLPSVTVPAKGSKIVSFTVSIPSDAEAGGNFAAIFWGTTPPNPENGQVAIGAKTGILVLLSVNGDVEVAGGVSDYDTESNVHYYESLPIPFSYRFRNDGGDRVKPDGDIIIKNLIGMVSARVPANPVEGNVLPTQTRRFETVWGGTSVFTPDAPAPQGFFAKAKHELNNFAFGHYTATLALAYGAGSTSMPAGTGAKTSFWVFPWHFLLLAIVIILIVYFIGKKGIRNYNSWIIKRSQTQTPNSTM